jgi:hypothetical protein
MSTGAWKNVLAPAPGSVNGANAIYLHSTPIVDDWAEKNSDGTVAASSTTTLATFFKRVQDSKLCMQTFINIDNSSAGCAWGEHRTNYFAPEAAFLFVAPESTEETPP